MSLIALSKYIKYKTQRKNQPTVTKANMTVLENSLEIEMNGIPSVIIIEYSGVVSFSRTMPVLFRSKIGLNRIVITNPFKQIIPKLLYNFSGNFYISKCKLINFDNSLVKVTVNNISESDKFIQNVTKVEDDDMILYEIKSKKKNKRRSYNAPKLIKSPHVSQIKKSNRIKGLPEKIKNEIPKTIALAATIKSRTLTRNVPKIKEKIKGGDSVISKY